MGEAAVDGAHTGKNFWTRVPLTWRILGSVALGVTAGIILGPSQRALLKGMGDFSKIFIDLLKALATPMIFFAVIDAIVRTNISGRKGFKLVCICMVNSAVAIAIGLGVANVLRTGDSWRGKLDVIAKDVTAAATPGTLKKVEANTSASMDIVKQIEGYIPKNFVDPFQSNSVISIVVIAILIGVALRHSKRFATAETLPAFEILAHICQAVLHLFALVLGWVIEILPVAIFCVVAKVVGETGVDLFKHLGVYMATILLGLFIHAAFYYSFILFVVGRVSPIKFFQRGSEAIFTAVSCASSLATLPVTLRCLKEKLLVSDANARLAACVGTNLNNDGIILYEAATTIFIAQAIGMEMSFAEQMTVAFASVMAGIGIAGIPEAGLITLQLVLVAGGIPQAVIATVLPLLFTVDWIIGRARATVNVISDMTVATLLERVDPDPDPESDSIVAPGGPELVDDKTSVNSVG